MSLGPPDETARLLMRLNGLIAHRAGEEYARLVPQAVAQKKQVRQQRSEVEAARRRLRRVGWLPLLGARERRRLEQAISRQADLEKQFACLRNSAETLQSVRSRALDLTTRLLRIHEGTLALPAPDDRFRHYSLGLARRVRLCAQTVNRGASAASVFDEMLPLVDEIDRLIAIWPQPAPTIIKDTRKDDEASPMPRKTSGPPPKGQFLLDFDGQGNRAEEPRIWLPVSVSRAREMRERGARIDKDASNRGSKLWIPFSERQKVDAFLPLAFRQKPTSLRYPPIRHNAVGSNLHTVFDKPSWNHIRSAAYDRAGHRCQLCGKQGGSLWNRLATAEEKRYSGPVDCHEVWEWQRSDTDARVGVQKLVRLLVVCKDCHLSFHDGYAHMRAERVGIEDQAARYLHHLRCLTNRCDDAEMAARMAEDRAAHQEVKDVLKWVLDLSHLASQDYMADHSLTLIGDNKAEVGPDRIGGIAFNLEDGTNFGATSAESLADGAKPRVLAFSGQEFRR